MGLQWKVGHVKKVEKLQRIYLQCMLAGRQQLLWQGTKLPYLFETPLFHYTYISVLHRDTFNLQSKYLQCRPPLRRPPPLFCASWVSAIQQLDVLFLTFCALTQYLGECQGSNYWGSISLTGTISLYLGKGSKMGRPIAVFGLKSRTYLGICHQAPVLDPISH